MSEETEQKLKHPGNAEYNADLMHRVALIMQDVSELAKSHRMLHEIVKEVAESGFDDTVAKCLNVPLL